MIQLNAKEGYYLKGQIDTECSSATDKTLVTTKDPHYIENEKKVNLQAWENVSHDPFSGYSWIM